MPNQTSSMKPYENSRSVKVALKATAKELNLVLCRRRSYSEFLYFCICFFDMWRSCIASIAGKYEHRLVWMVVILVYLHGEIRGGFMVLVYHHFDVLCRQRYRVQDRTLGIHWLTHLRLSKKQNCVCNLSPRRDYLHTHHEYGVEVGLE